VHEVSEPAPATTLTIPDPSLVLLVGASGAGKSTFAARHFLPTEVLSSDRFRALVSDDETDQSATGAAFDALRFVCEKRSDRGRLTVIDATNVHPIRRRPFLEIAQRHGLDAVAIVLLVPVALAEERNVGRPGRSYGMTWVVRNQNGQLLRSLRGMRDEGFAAVHVLSGAEAIGAASIVRERVARPERVEVSPPAGPRRREPRRGGRPARRPGPLPER
jgi:predicted kinase